MHSIAESEKMHTHKHTHFSLSLVVMLLCLGSATLRRPSPLQSTARSHTERCASHVHTKNHSRTVSSVFVSTLHSHTHSRAHIYSHTTHTPKWLCGHTIKSRFPHRGEKRVIRPTYPEHAPHPLTVRMLSTCIAMSSLCAFLPAPISIVFNLIAYTRESW